MRKAFTLIEMLVVLAIIGILMGLIAPKLLGALRSSREATCRMNLKNLQVAVNSFATDHTQISDNDWDGNMPRAGSYELRGTHRYHEFKGWVSWIPKSAKAEDWPNWNDRNPHVNDMKDAKHYGEEALLAIRKGSLFKYTGDEVGVYSCPVAVHDKAFRTIVGATKRTDKVYLSYVMNGFFYHHGRDDDKNGKADHNWHARELSWIGTSEKTRADGQDVIPDANRLVLFAEHSGVPWTSDNVIGKNCVLSVKDDDSTKPVTRLSGNKVPGIGGYHDGPIKLRDSDDKVIPWGLVIFVDGHIDKLFRNVRDPSSTIENTAWLLTRGRDLPDKTSN